MRTIEEEKYIRAYAKIMEMDVEDVASYTEKKGMYALIENPMQILSSHEQKERFEAFL